MAIHGAYGERKFAAISDRFAVQLHASIGASLQFNQRAKTTKQKPAHREHERRQRRVSDKRFGTDRVALSRSKPGIVTRVREKKISNSAAKLRSFV